MKSTELLQQIDREISYYRSGKVSLQTVAVATMPLIMQWMEAIEERLEALEKRPITVESTPAKDIPDPNEPGPQRA